MHFRVRMRVFVCASLCVCVRLRVHARGPICACARASCVCAAVCVCAFTCARAAVLPRRALLKGYSRAAPLVLAGHQPYSESTRGHSSGSLGVCSWGVLRGTQGSTPRKCGRVCDTVHLLGSYGTSQQGRTALHVSARRTGSTGGVLDEYSRRLYVVRSIAARASAQ
jgi:hypothetical protein